MASVAFDRLKDKAHTLLPTRGGSYRQRIDHTLAGARIARSIARSLRLNEDLAEAIALGRDLGAPAFARAGDEALSLFTDEPFRHNHQSLRVVEVLEDERAGLNLTWEVRDGIACHSLDAPTPATREGEAVRLADRIAGVAGEIGDALRAGVVLPEDLPAAALAALGPDPASWVRALVRDAVAASADTPEVRLGETAWSLLEDLDELVRTRIADRHAVLAERARGAHCLSGLVVFYVDNPRRLPAAYRAGDDPPVVRAIDFVTSLGDGQALALFSQLFLPRLGPAA
jgi:dGTPase